jgi:hypothetical protein
MRETKLKFRNLILKEGCHIYKSKEGNSIMNLKLKSVKRVHVFVL